MSMCCMLINVVGMGQHSGKTAASRKKYTEIQNHSSSQDCLVITYLSMPKIQSSTLDLKLSVHNCDKDEYETNLTQMN